MLRVRRGGLEDGGGAAVSRAGAPAVQEPGAAGEDAVCASLSVICVSTFVLYCSVSLFQFDVCPCGREWLSRLSWCWEDHDDIPSVFL